MKRLNFYIQLFLLIITLGLIALTIYNDGFVFWLYLLAIPVGFFQLLMSSILFITTQRNYFIGIHFIASIAVLIILLNTVLTTFYTSYDWAMLTCSTLAIYYWIITFTVLHPDREKENVLQEEKIN